MQKLGSGLAAVSAIFGLSALGSFLLFRLLESFAFISGSGYEAGGALAGFILLYWVLHRSFCRVLQLQEPRLTGRQTLDLLHLFQEDVKYRILRTVFGWIDEVEMGHELPPMETRFAIIDKARHQPRQYITDFRTPIPDFYARVEEKGRSRLFRQALDEGMAIVDSEIPSSEKRQRLYELADSVQREHYNEYVQELTKLGAFWGRPKKKLAKSDRAVSSQ